MKKKVVRWSIFIIVITLLVTLPGGALGAGVNQRVSVSTGGGESDGTSGYPVLSSDGRYVAFISDATNLTSPAESSADNDVFVHDRKTLTTTRASLATDGSIPDAAVSYTESFSGNGRFVAFQSPAKNLTTPAQTNDFEDIFVRDTKTGVTELISVSTGGGEANGDSIYPSISDDGRYVAFASAATNLVSNDSNGAVGDIFVRDRKTKTTVIASITNGKLPSDNDSVFPAISGDGRYVAFASYSDLTSEGNGAPDIFLHDLKTRQTRLASVTSAGAAGEGIHKTLTSAISADGRYVVFASDYEYIVGSGGRDYQVYLRDMKANTTVCVSVTPYGLMGNSDSNDPAISADGRFVTFTSEAANLVEGDTHDQDVFVRDMKAGVTRIASETSLGINPNQSSAYSDISGDGTVVAFMSLANNLLEDGVDGNGLADVFVACNPVIAPTLKSPAYGKVLPPGVDKVKLTWLPVVSVNKKLIGGYQVQVSEGRHFVNIVKDVVTSKTNLQVKGLLPNQTYLWRVRPLLKDGTPCSWTPGGNEGHEFFTALIKAPKLVKPKNNSLEKKANIVLTWARPKGAPKTTAYVLQYDDDPAFGSPEETLNVTRTKYTIAALPVNAAPVAYYWRVKAISADGLTDYSEWSAVRQFRR
jgi:Tol biopolymer transport system component